MQLQEKSTSVAKHRANLISPPKRCRRGRAILAYRLQQAMFTVSQCSHGLYLDAIRVSGVGENLAIRCATREVPLFLVR